MQDEEGEGDEDLPPLEEDAADEGSRMEEVGPGPTTAALAASSNIRPLCDSVALLLWRAVCTCCAQTFCGMATRIHIWHASTRWGVSPSPLLGIGSCVCCACSHHPLIRPPVYTCAGGLGFLAFPLQPRSHAARLRRLAPAVREGTGRPLTLAAAAF